MAMHSSILCSWTRTWRTGSDEGSSDGNSDASDGSTVGGKDADGSPGSQPAPGSDADGSSNC